MTTLEDIRKAKGFSSARQFALTLLGVTPAFYSQIIKGKCPVSPRVVDALNKKYHPENFDFLITDRLLSSSEFVKPDAIIRRQGDTILPTYRSERSLTRIGDNRRIPVISILDRANLVEIESKEFRGMDIFYIPSQSLSNQRANYFILEAVKEPFVEEIIRIGDKLLCYSVPQEFWGRIKGFILIFLGDGSDVIIQVEENQIWDGQGDSYISYRDKQYLPSDIKAIYQVESIIYRKL